MIWRFAAGEGLRSSNPSRLVARRTLVLLLVLAAIGLISVKASGRYPGAPAVYIGFCVVFALVLAISMSRGAPYVFLYTGVFLWLGLWAKATAHLIVDYRTVFGMSFLEPIGRFTGSPGEWDDVLTTAAAGGLGAVAAAILWRGILARFPLGEPRYDSVPIWYRRHRAVVLVVVTVAVAGLIICNEALRILKLGWRPEVVLPWPLGGVFAWSFYVGAAIVIAVIAQWEWKTRRLPWLAYALPFTAAWALSASMMSRSGFLFQAGPYLVASAREEKFRRVLGWRGIVLLAGVFMIFVGASLVTVSYQRYMAPNRLPLQTGELAGELPKPSSPPGPKDLLRKGEETFLALLVDRWPGLEGVMVVSAHPDKGAALILRAARERRTLDRVDLYTKISGSPFMDEHTARYHYAAVPGPVGLLYLSGSRAIVFAGMFAFVFSAILLEIAARKALGNAFLTSVVGMFLAVLVTQLTPGLGQKALVVIALIALCAVLAVIVRTGDDSEHGGSHAAGPYHARS